MDDDDINELKGLLEEIGETDHRKRAEEIQVLVALGVLGGAVSLYVKKSLLSSTYSPVLLLIALSSIGFLVFKTLLPAVRANRELNYPESRLARFDEEWIQMIYSFLVFLSVISVIGIFLSQEDLSLNLVQMKLAPVVSILLSSLLTYLYWKLVRVTKKKEIQRAKRLKENVDQLEYDAILAAIDQNPGILDRDIDSISREQQVGSEGPVFDLIAKSEDKTLLIEVKTNRVPLETINQLIGIVMNYRDRTGEDAKMVLIAPSLTQSAYDRINQSHFIEVILLNEG